MEEEERRDIIKYVRLIDIICKKKGEKPHRSKSIACSNTTYERLGKEKKSYERVIKTEISLLSLENHTKSYSI